MKPRVSVIVGTYNGEKYVADQLRSICRQDYPNLEIIVHDDASTDGTWNVLTELQREDPRLRIFRNPSNLGVSKNFEQGRLKGTGPLVAPSDQDDIWEPAKLSTLVAHLGDKAMVYGDSTFIDADNRALGGLLSDVYQMYAGSDPRAFALMNSVSGHAMLMRRELLDAALPFPEKSHSDWWLAFVAAQTGGIAYVDAPLVRYRKHAAGVTAKRRKSAAQKQLEQQAAFDAMAAFAGPQRPFFAELAGLWRERAGQWISWGLFRFLARHAAIVFGMKKNRPGSPTHALKYLWGLKTHSALERR